MAANPYAPPKAVLADGVNDVASPALWNPGAAANWCLLFSPAFGAFLHMKNWEALGEPGKATAAKIWIILSLAVFAVIPVANALMAGNNSVGGIGRLCGIVLLFGWYFSSGRGQMKYVKSRFGTGYPRKSWGKPILIALAAFAGYFVYASVVAFVVLAATAVHRT